jgi:hypothetical protein
MYVGKFEKLVNHGVVASVSLYRAKHTLQDQFMPQTAAASQSAEKASCVISCALQLQIHVAVAG